ncbi:MAG: hypothetical protein ACR2HF_00385 [Methylococcaceae bacterium]
MQLDGTFIFDGLDRYEMYQSFCLHAQHLVSKSGAKDYSINDDAFADTIIEIEHDLRIISYRRITQASVTGIGRGKVAGIYAFRLSRAPILNFCKGGQGKNSERDKEIPASVSLLTALNSVDVSVDSIEVAVLKEIIYNIRKRHVNQETLALVIDILISQVRQQG